MVLIDKIIKSININNMSCLIGGDFSISLFLDFYQKNMN